MDINISFPRVSEPDKLIRFVNEAIEGKFLPTIAAFGVVKQRIPCQAKLPLGSQVLNFIGRWHLKYINYLMIYLYSKKILQFFAWYHFQCRTIQMNWRSFNQYF